MRLSLLTLVVLLLLAGTAQAQGELEQATDNLALDPVYVDPDAERALSDDQAERLRDRITKSDAGPLYIAVLEADAAREAGGDSAAALREIAVGVDEPGTYAAVVGNEFRAGATEGALPQGVAGELATESLQAEKGRGTAAVLNDFVERVDQAQAGNGPSSNGGGDGGGFPTVLVVVLGGAAALFGVSMLRRRRREREQRALELEQVRAAAREDLVALGDDIRALDLDVEMPGVDEQAKEHYNLAVERYQEASQALEGARRAEDVEAVTSLLEEGRWAMVAAKARLAGEEVPERRPPCFFDPRHGPSVRDMEWAPPGGEPRPVPVCAADATRLEYGQEPDMRQVEVNGERVPYWNAGPAFAPWAGGFYGSGLLPGLFVGSLLGGAWFDGPDVASAAEQGDFGDFGGGDFGGGFGGGDFGGGGDF
jgi:uncharacterized membrane protein YgcG